MGIKGEERKKTLFLTGTRADFGKLKPLMQTLQDDERFDVHIFATGMHTLSRYGFTLDEIHKSGFRNIYSYMNHIRNEPMDMILANTIQGLSRYVNENKPDLIVVHGDRVETLAGAIVGSLNNILVAHIEGGEQSGTIDELIRHSVTKMSHAHFVANEDAANVVKRMGEHNIFVIGSPDIDVMLSDELPSLQEAKEYYEIELDKYAIALYHTVTTEHMKKQSLEFADALLRSSDNYVVIYPNNDSGSGHIFDRYKRIEHHSRFKFFPSIRFEYFLTLLKNAQYIIGNSSAGIREAPVYGVPTVNVGTRQNNRANGPTIINTSYDSESISNGIDEAKNTKIYTTQEFGNGDSAKRFLDVLTSDQFWYIPKQKELVI